MASIQCRYPGCNRVTRNPQGLCYQHLSMPVPNVAHPGAPNLMAENQMHNGMPPRVASSPDQIISEIRRAFPDLPEGQPSLGLVREQIEQTIRAAVEIETYRRYPITNVESAEDRASMIRTIHQEMFNDGPRPVSISDADAIALSRSSEDVYGRGYSDSMGLAAYGFRKEWQLAHALGVEHDQNGVSYGRHYEVFMTGIQRRVETIMADEFVRATWRYPYLIRDVTGEPPRCVEPLVPGQNMTPAPLSWQEPQQVPTGNPVPMSQVQLQPQQSPASRIVGGIGSFISSVKADDVVRVKDKLVDMYVDRQKASSQRSQERREKWKAVAAREAAAKREREDRIIRKAAYKRAKSDLGIWF